MSLPVPNRLNIHVKLLRRLALVEAQVHPPRSDRITNIRNDLRVLFGLRSLTSQGDMAKRQRRDAVALPCAPRDHVT